MPATGCAEQTSIKVNLCAGRFQTKESAFDQHEYALKAGDRSEYIAAKSSSVHEAQGFPACLGVRRSTNSGARNAVEVVLGELSIWHWLVVLIVIMLLFGSGKVSHLMGDFAKGIKAFRQNMQDDPEIKPSQSMAAAQPPVLGAAAPEVLVTSAERLTAVEKVPAHHES